jgi:uroporphyrinogen decarboxylase
MSPQALWEFDFQYMKELVKEIHNLGVPVILHACGNVNKALPMLVGVGIDCLQGLQPTAHNDIAAIKDCFGDTLCLMGYMDLNYLLPKASPREVMDGVRKTIKVAAKGGGYMLSTCNMLNGDVPPENALAMYMAGARYGIYS